MNVCVVGAGSAIAKEVIKFYSSKGDSIIGVSRWSWDCDHAKIITWDEFCQESTQPIDVMITLVGDVVNSKLSKMSLDDWNRVINGTLTSVFRALRYGIQRVVDHGNVVVVGSIVGSIGGYGCANYAAAKSGLVGLVRACANEVVDRGVVVNLLELGYASIGMGENLSEEVKQKVIATIPLKRLASAEEVIEAIDFLAMTRYMTGNILTLAGGLR